MAACPPGVRALPHVVCAFGLVLTHTLYMAILPGFLIDARIVGLELGLVLSGFAIGTLTGRFLVCLRATSRWDEKTLALVGSGGLILSQAGFLVFPPGLPVAGLRFANGIANALFFLCLFSNLSTSSRAGSREVGMIGAAAAAALVVGPVTGLAIVRLGKPELVYAIGLAAAVVSAVSVLRLVFAKRTQASPDSQSGEPAPRGSYRLIASITLVGCALGGLEAALPLAKVELGPVLMGASFAAFGVAFIFGKLIGGALAISPWSRWLVPSALALSAAFCLWVITKLGGTQVFVSAIVLGATLGLVGTILMVGLKGGIPAATGRNLVRAQLQNDIGLGVGIFAASSLSVYGIGAAFAVVAASCTVAAGLLAAGGCGRQLARHGPYGTPASNAPGS